MQIETCRAAISAASSWVGASLLGAGGGGAGAGAGGGRKGVDAGEGAGGNGDGGDAGAGDGGKSGGGAAGAVGAGGDGGGILSVPVVQLVTRGCPLTARHEFSMGALPFLFRMQ